MLSIKLDVHTHSIASGHGTADTITDMAREASSRGLQLLAVTEHGPATVNSCKSSYFRNIRHAPGQRFGVRMMYGCEVNILDYKGRLDMPGELLQELDINIASLHPQTVKPGSAAENTEAVLAAVRNPHIHMIGHPDDAAYPLDYRRIVEEAMRYHVLLELNNASLRPDGYRGDTRRNDMAYLRLCKEYGYPIVLTSDSHGRERIGCFEEALKLLKAIDFPDDLILNYDAEMFQQWIKTIRTKKNKIKETL